MHSRLIVALDYKSAAAARRLVGQINPALCGLKVGQELFTAEGPDLVKELVKQEFSVFLDLKFHDIPQTVAQACAAAADLGVWMINVHAWGGRRMMEAARDALAQYKAPPQLIAVTVLTSLVESDFAELGVDTDVPALVLNLAKLAKSCAFDGVVCSGREARILREELGSDFTLVTPGIRLNADNNDDQRRIMTPKEALLAGADYLVIGRPIREAANPLAVLEQFNRQINEENMS